MNINPLLQTWATPHGIPPFDQIKPEHYKPALEEAMAIHRAEIEAIANQASAPTFENTVVAYEGTGEVLNRVANVFFNMTASETSDALQEVERDLAPIIAAHQNWVSLHEGIFKRVAAVYDARSNLKLSPEDLRLLERIHLDFVLAGATLSGQARTRYAQITEELAGLYTSFGQAVLADEASWHIELSTEQDKAGLPDFVLDAAKSVAESKGLTGYAISLSPSIVDPFLTYSTRRDLREKVWKAFKSRGEMDPQRLTLPLATKIVQLRGELATIMGYKSYADYALVDRMAKTPARVAELLEKVWGPAKTRAAQEQADMEALAKTEGFTDSIEGWDWFYYAEKVRQARYDLDEALIKPYFQLNRMIEAMFDAASKLYQITFKEITGQTPLHHPDARLFEVRNQGDNSMVGIFISDNFARATKRGGAWMSEFRDQSAKGSGGYTYPIIINNNNFAKAPEGKPTLLSFDDVRTLFHEFGHGLHGLLSKVTYGRLSGTNVLRDFVELPSQINEHWALTPEILKKHAIHASTGEAIGDDLIALIKKASHFNQGFKTVEYTACALMDMSLHQVPDTSTLDLKAFEISESKRLGIPAAIGMRHRLPHFRHLFVDDGYAAGYYVYMWAEVLDADGFEAFEASGDVFNQELAAKFKRYILSAGNTMDPSEAYRAFRGRDPEVAAVLRGRGLV